MTKVLISLPEDLLAAIDREADARGLSRSAFLRAAAEHELRWRNPARVMAALARGQAAAAGLGPADAAEEIARTRRERTEHDRRL
jgi:metal-responsive CopG/Arc/MetJ family transcriptional regulator